MDFITLLEAESSRSVCQESSSRPVTYQLHGWLTNYMSSHSRVTKTLLLSERTAYSARSLDRRPSLLTSAQWGFSVTVHVVVVWKGTLRPEHRTTKGRLGLRELLGGEWNDMLCVLLMLGAVGDESFTQALSGCCWLDISSLPVCRGGVHEVWVRGFILWVSGGSRNQSLIDHNLNIFPPTCLVYLCLVSFQPVTWEPG